MSKILFFICLPLLLGCVQFLGLLLALLPKLIPFQKIKAMTKCRRKQEKKFPSGWEDDLYLVMFARVKIFTMNCCLQPGETANIHCSQVAVPHLEVVESILHWADVEGIEILQMACWPGSEIVILESQGCGLLRFLRWHSYFVSLGKISELLPSSPILCFCSFTFLSFVRAVMLQENVSSGQQVLSLSVFVRCFHIELPALKSFISLVFEY